MSADAFEVLGLPRLAGLDVELVRSKYFSLAKEADSEGRQGELNEALAWLVSPERRLKLWLQLAEPECTGAWSAVAMPEELMSLFLQLGELKLKADGVMQRRAAATNALSKALLQPQALKIQTQAVGIAAAVEEQLTRLCGYLPEVDRGEMSLDEVRTLQAHLSYVVKWQAQVRELILVLG